MPRIAHSNPDLEILKLFPPPRPLPQGEGDFQGRQFSISIFGTNYGLDSKCLNALNYKGLGL